MIVDCMSDAFYILALGKQHVVDISKQMSEWSNALRVNVRV